MKMQIYYETWNEGMKRWEGVRADVKGDLGYKLSQEKYYNQNVRFPEPPIPPEGVVYATSEVVFSAISSAVVRNFPGSIIKTPKGDSNQEYFIRILNNMAKGNPTLENKFNTMIKDLADRASVKQYHKKIQEISDIEYTYYSALSKVMDVPKPLKTKTNWGIVAGSVLGYIFNPLINWGAAIVQGAKQGAEKGGFLNGVWGGLKAFVLPGIWDAIVSVAQYFRGIIQFFTNDMKVADGSQLGAWDSFKKGFLNESNVFLRSDLASEAVWDAEFDILRKAYPGYQTQFKKEVEQIINNQQEQSNPKKVADKDKGQSLEAVKEQFDAHKSKTPENLPNADVASGNKQFTPITPMSDLKKVGSEALVAEQNLANKNKENLSAIPEKTPTPKNK